MLDCNVDPPSQQTRRILGLICFGYGGQLKKVSRELDDLWSGMIREAAIWLRVF